MTRQGLWGTGFKSACVNSRSGSHLYLGSIHFKNRQSCRRSNQHGCTFRTSRHISVQATQRMLLPNGKEISVINKDEVAFLYKEIFEDKSYLQHGIDLKPGDTVLDVGANIGLFSLFAATMVGPKGKIIAVEPIPPTYAALQANAKSAAHESQIIALNVGAGAQETHSSFTYYPHATGWSTMLPDEKDVEKSMTAFLGNALETQSGLPKSPLATLGRILYRILPKPLLRAVFRMYTMWMLRGRQQFDVPIKTVSGIMKEQKLDQVHLLKIDVERGELAVLQGIESDDWSRISQIVMEVHEDMFTHSDLKHHLQELGFKHFFQEQSAILKGTSLLSIYAGK